MPYYADPAADNAITNRAQQAAQAEYQRSMANNAGEELALRRAQFAWQQELDRSSMTGQWQGAPSVPFLSQTAQMFGAWGAPMTGQQTLEAQQQAYRQAYENAQAYGQYYAPGTAPTQGQQTQAAQQQQFGQGFQTWQEQARQEQARQASAQSYLTLLSQLRGPADWAKYQEVLGATPGGMRDLTAAAMGQYIPGGGATTGAQPQAMNLQTLQGQVQGGLPPAAGGGTNMFGNLPAPNQIAPESWKNMAPSQQQMMLGQYEAQGWHKPDVEALFSQSLPRYAANAPSAGTWRLQ